MSTLDVAGIADPICAAIEAAEEVRDPLEDLVERTAANPGAAFTPEVLERLVVLRREDQAFFEVLRAQLKKAGCRVTALDDAIAEQSGDIGGRGPTQADILIDLAQAAELFSEKAFWPTGTFWSAYCGNRDEAVEGVIDGDPISTAVRAVMARRTVWTGTASDLLGALAEIVGERVSKSKTWPDGPRALAGRLRRAATFLRKVGIEIGFAREGRARTRIISITTTQPFAAPEKLGTQPSAPSASSAPTPKSNPINGFSAQSVRTVAPDADASGNGNAPTVRANPLKNNAGTAADGADANLPAQSGQEKTGTPGWSTRL